MDKSTIASAQRLIPVAYLEQASEARQTREKKKAILLEQRKCPEEGWDDDTIELFIKDLSLMDSNNFLHNCGAGEREGRIQCDLVRRRHYGFSHGIGRSGDIAEVQPKATGSSLLYKLTNAIVLDLIRSIGVPKTSACLVVPLATGMSIMLCLSTLRLANPAAKVVIWCRIDQKSCIKAVALAGLELIVIENRLEGDELRTDVAEIERQFESLGADMIAAVITTTSCFAPRGIDCLEEVAQLCAKHNIPHIVNNAYGLMDTKCLHHIQQAARLGRIDAFVQSTDKNFMVPVGGAIIAGFDGQFIKRVGAVYPGRASSSPILDLFVAILSLGVNGYKELIKERKVVKAYLLESLMTLAEKCNLRVLVTKNNPISIALTLPDIHNISELGAMLFRRGVSGARVISNTSNDSQFIAGINFEGWGAHCPRYPHRYLTVAAGIGMTRHDVDTLMPRLAKCLDKFVPTHSPGKSPSVVTIQEKTEEVVVDNE